MYAQVMTKSSLWKKTLAAFALAAFVFIAYGRALGTGFFGSDYEFLPVPALLSPVEYLNRYFNPYMQNMWYHPYQGLQWGFEYVLFGNNAAAYHVIQLLQHVVNAWLLFALVGRTTAQWRAAFVAALVWAGLPSFNLSVLWPANPDPLEAIFILLTTYFWWLYLQKEKARYFAAAYLAFLSAILSKEISVTLPIILLLFDRLIVRKPATISQLIRRYALFFVTLIPYAIIEYIVQTRSLFTQQFGWSIGVHVLTNALFFFQQLVFPWGIYAPWTYVMLGIGFVIVAYAIAARRNLGLLFLICFSSFALAPIIPFPSFQYPRYLYTPIMSSAIVFAMLWERLWVKYPRLLAHGALVVLIATLMLYNSTIIADAADNFGGLARVNRLPFRDFSQRHPTLEAGTYLFFISPPTPTRELFAMFLARYGNNVTMTGSDLNPVANLRAHPRTIVVYYDGDRQEEQVVDNGAQFIMSLSLPAQFTAPFRLQSFEVANSHLKRGDALVLILYWSATGKPSQDYNVFAHLENERGDVIASLDNPPGVPTSEWFENRALTDIRLIRIPSDTPVGAKYRVKVGWYDPVSQARLSVVDALGKPIADGIEIGQFTIVE